MRVKLCTWLLSRVMIEYYPMTILLLILYVPHFLSQKKNKICFNEPFYEDVETKGGSNKRLFGKKHLHFLKISNFAFRVDLL